jgi:hypothetical protein
MRQCKHPTCGDTCRRPTKEKKLYTIKRTPITRKPCKIKPVSKKRSKQNEEYLKQKETRFDPWTECEIKSPVCTFLATVEHHTNGRENERLLIIEDRKKSCAACNIWIETSDGTAWAYEHGHKKRKHGLFNTLRNQI